MLPSLIHGDQTGYIKGRFIGQNVRLIADIIVCTDTLDIEGIALFLDFKKAFDSLEWNVLKALETFGFGASLVQWVKTFYNNIQSCVINNGYATPFFELQRGVRQGCPLSGILFVIAVEILANSIRDDQSIMGINIKGKEYKLSQYADDTSCFVRDIDSVVKLFEKLEAFKSCSGLELNRSKTEAMWLGKNNPQPTNLFGINWPPKCVCVWAFASLVTPKYLQKIIIIGGKSIFYRQWYTAGVKSLSDILDEDGNFFYISKTFQNPTSKACLIKAGFTDRSIEALYILPFKVIKNIKLSMFQFKINHHILYTRDRLFRAKIIENDECQLFGVSQTLEHLFVECRHVQSFWNLLVSWWNSCNSPKVALTNNAKIYAH